MLWFAWFLTCIAYCSLVVYLAYGYWHSCHPNRIIVTSLATFIILSQGFLLHHWIDGADLQNLSLANVLSTIIWVSLVLITLVNLFWPVASLLLVVAPMGLLLIGFAWFDDNVLWVNTRASAVLFWHVLIAILAVATLAAAGLQALFMYAHHYLLKTKRHMRWLSFFPSIETQGRLLLGFIILGFILLTILIINGIFLWYGQPALGFSLIPSIGLAWIAWLLFLSLLLNECLRPRQSLRLVQGTLLGFVIVLLAYFGTRWLSG